MLRGAAGALQAGLSLSMRNVLSILILLYATTLVTGLGAVALAAHEILRQVWIFAIQCAAALVFLACTV